MVVGERETGQANEPGVCWRERALGRCRSAKFSQHRHTARQRIAVSRVGGHEAECRSVVGKFCRCRLVRTGLILQRQQHAAVTPQQ
ncbi:hypothetical protein ACFYQ5_23570 [Streptomyces sp. NPDC005794]|uniref:hypothetical protein n=1 Tax=Streptomyces sp. NPDC005794 TaxID=3364733 RepID=UPI00369F87B5